MSFDLSTVVLEQSVELELRHPVSKEPLGAKIHLAGQQHPLRKKIVHERQRRLRKQFQRSGKFAFVDPAEEEEDTLEFVVGCTLGWSGISFDGKPLDFSPDNARRIYADPKLAWLRDQVVALLYDDESFIHTSASS
jgi:hypothetical protein